MRLSYYTALKKVHLPLKYPRDGVMVIENQFYHVCTVVQIYTLVQKKRNFSEPIFPGDPRSLTLAPSHVHCNIYTIKFIYLHSSQKETQLSMLHFF